MKKIEFRGWDKKYKVMFGGEYYNPDEYFFEFDGLGNIKAEAFDAKEGDDIVRNVDCILMQYTGLKDKKGVEIYECDVIKFGGEVCFVVFENGRFLLKGDTRSYAMWSHINDKKVNNGIEIIGNIYENPELIKK